MFDNYAVTVMIGGEPYTLGWCVAVSPGWLASSRAERLSGAARVPHAIVDGVSVTAG